MAELDEVARGADRPLVVLRVDRGQSGAADVRVDGHDGLGGGNFDDGRRDEDRAVGQCAAQTRERTPLPPLLAVHATRVHDELEPRVLDGPRRSLEQLGAERLDAGDEDADDVRSLAPEAPGDEARLEVELVDRFLYPRDRSFGDPVAAVDDSRHGRDGHAGKCGDVADRDPRSVHRHCFGPPSPFANVVENVYNIAHHDKTRQTFPPGSLDYTARCARSPWLSLSTTREMETAWDQSRRHSANDSSPT